MLAHSWSATLDYAVHSLGSPSDRSPPEGAPCATLSTLTYYRTSRSFHFPFGQYVPFLDPNRISDPSVGTHQYIGKLVGCLLFLSIDQRSGVPARRRVRGPRAPLARTTLGRSGPRRSTLTLKTTDATLVSVHVDRDNLNGRRGARACAPAICQSRNADNRGQVRSGQVYDSAEV